jgi:hypothetical protein
MEEFGGIILFFNIKNISLFQKLFLLFKKIVFLLNLITINLIEKRRVFF